ncbi:glycoside hydrolase family 2 protein [Coniochaeta ligniaria NRRL 30616]|uniref:Glycoside hydrolase family 2 protein n=1 Tax=Coniochaeta ligniaria NRRL 30616 TaxID=1408157 RepID=A0A1J7J4F3_9PEZI|nr:glycoside hydrolase family 2 protein [Coniochaeta ligniaria NRRL 30616]
MARPKYAVLLSGLIASITGADARSCSLVSTPGQVGVIPKWDVQSTSQVTTDPLALAKPGVDTSSWHHANVPRCTIMACLLASPDFKETDTEIFYSDNLDHFDTDQFRVPWLYRNEFALKPAPGQHYFLQTNGITSRADVFLNGKKVADKVLQSGAYGGHSYEVTDIVNRTNAVVIKVYPTDYFQDFGVGFVDWNPRPSDNGTGVWREVNIKQTGPVALGPLRITTTFDKPVGQGSAVVTLKATVQNLENKVVTFVADGSVGSIKLTKSVTLQPLALGEVSLQTTIDNPNLWWPAKWGAQTLYDAQLSVSVDKTVSDKTEKKFGIRQVTHQINAFNDSIFSVNGRPFQVLGAGYSSDIFLRWDTARFTTQMQYVLDMGMNTVRLEGKLEHPEFYEVTDRLGVMVMPGWECCDKWEAWSYNDNIENPAVWSDADYDTANASIYHEAATLQTHPSVLMYFVGSDFWPNDRAAAIYVGALKALDWQLPIIPYAARKDGYPAIVGPPSMKMDGPYDWVPPNYWWDVTPSSDRLGAAFGFGSELGPGVGTPELSSLTRFLSPSDLSDLWQKPNASVWHMSAQDSSFATREIYNLGLYGRYGAPEDLDDYLLKAQMMDYEATRAEYEGFSALWNAERPATGLIYWMLNGAWPNLHWALFDYYLHPAGAYFGTKVGGRTEHVAYDYVKKGVYLINHSLDKAGARTVEWEVMGLDGKSVVKGTVATTTVPNTSKSVADLSKALGSVKGVVFLKLVLSDGKSTLSRNVYWLGATVDTLDWADSSWYHTPVSKFVDLSGLDKLKTAAVTTTVLPGSGGLKVVLSNKATVPAFFVRANLVDSAGEDVNPVFWSDNYVTLWPGETLELDVSYAGGKAAKVQVSGKNVAKAEVAVP